MSVLPQGYREPVTSNYMKWEQGENTFRILSPVITGMEYWTTDSEDKKKPVRLKPEQEIPLNELEADKDGNLIMPKHFWAMIVWNYGADKVQILEITQQGIRKSITSFENNKKWGDAREYDITVEREGEGFDTKYMTTPNPKEEIDEGIVQMAKDMNIDLEALYKGDDPFNQVTKEEEEAFDKTDIIKNHLRRTLKEKLKTNE